MLGRRTQRVPALLVACASAGACAMVALLSTAAAAQDRPPMSRSGVESQFYDTRIPADERQVLQSAEGFSLPPLPEGAQWVSETSIDFAESRGKVIVIQSFTRDDADGRAAVRRTSEIVEKLGLEDVLFVGLHTPQGADEAETFYAKRKPNEPTILDRSGAFCDELGVYQRPVTMLIDRNGRIRYSGVALSRLRPAIELLAAESAPGGEAPPPLPARDTRIDSAPPKLPPAAMQDFPKIEGSVGSARDVRGKPGPSISGLSYLSPKPETEGRVVMVEFWATWCGPCVANIPHLNALQKEFADSVTIIGVSDEDEGKVSNFVRNRKMAYTIALDPNGAINRSLDIKGIPHAIIMSADGIVRWQGHPGGLEEDTLRQIVRASSAASAGSGPKQKRWIQPE